MKQWVKVSLVSVGLVLASVVVAFAHAVVTPDQVGVGAFQTFSLGVPVEKDNPTVAVRLVMPDGLQEVTPNVKSAWKIDVKRTGQDSDAPVTEIDWSGGTIPPGEREEFRFSAQVPAKPTTLKWKVYQTYQNGDVVAWDQDPAKIAKGEEGTPYSQTQVVNDLTGNSSLPLDLSIAALVASLAALSLSLQKRR